MRNKNGIRIDKKVKKIQDEKLKEITMKKRVKGQLVTIVIPDFTHVHDAMVADGWLLKNNTEGCQNEQKRAKSKAPRVTRKNRQKNGARLTR